MAYDLDLTDNSASLAWDGRNKQVVLTKEVDFSVAANQLANTKNMCLFNIPAGVLIDEVLAIVKTADADISDIDIGIFTASTQAVISVDGFVDGADISTTGIKRDLAGETYSKTNGTAGYYCTVDTDIVVTNNDAQTINGAVVVFVALCTDLR